MKVFNKLGGGLFVFSLSFDDWPMEIFPWIKLIQFSSHWVWWRCHRDDCWVAFNIPDIFHCRKNRREKRLTTQDDVVGVKWRKINSSPSTVGIRRINIMRQTVTERGKLQTMESGLSREPPSASPCRQFNWRFSHIFTRSLCSVLKQQQSSNEEICKLKNKNFLLR